MEYVAVFLQLQLFGPCTPMATFLDDCFVFHGVLTCKQYHAGQNYYVEVDIVMDENVPLKVSHDVSQTLQRKLEGTHQETTV